ncbi:MAG TPA: DUF5989 family protein [Gemmatimonadaceae bacterium]|jgi:hypothetical protein
MQRVSVLGELWGFMRVRKKLWLLPLLIIVGAVGVLAFAVQGSALAPFIYSIF